ncbi:MAG TPA: sugar transferase [Vitreimonas sp.]|nr:sugar transferase [Vitreimonas sp.]
MLDGCRPEAISDEDRVHCAPPLHALHPAKTFRVRRLRPVGGALKRAFDIVAATAALAILSPFLLFVALLIVLESPGSALFLQRRGGVFGRPFLIYKFRTMSTVDDGRIVYQAVQNDPRLTRLGAILRELCIDELPQLINVVRGEMSLVGPRPHAVAHDDAFAGIDPRYPRRRRARPGLTGLAQVSGCRGLAADAASVLARTGFDVEYVDNWSFWLDLKIVFKTVLILLRLKTDQHTAPVAWRRAY